MRFNLGKDLSGSLNKINPSLKDIPETMLWTLHNRAYEAARSDGCIRDEKCLEIYRALDYDYQQHFGAADGSHGVRSQLFDAQIRAFLSEHPDGVIVNLGEGLETQRFRIDNDRSLWISVDVPEAIAIRERFILPDERHLHIAQSALDTGWFDAVPDRRAVFISAQGLLMYFQEDEVRTLMKNMAARFSGAMVMFDYLNRILSRRTLSKKGWMKTPYYRTPPMPWGINRDDIQPTLSRWLGAEVVVHNVTFLFPRGMERWMVPLFEKISPINNIMPGVCRLRLP